MDSPLFEFMHRKRSPVFNEDICKGIATKEVPFAQAYVDSRIRCGESQYPEGFEFVGSERCSPIEEYNVITRPRSGNSNRTFDIAKSDIYLVKYQFRNQGRDLAPVYVYLPFVRDAGMMYMSGKQFAVSPVMGDIAFEIEENSVFIRIPRAPMTFSRESHAIVVDGRRVNEQVVYSRLHNKKSKKRSQLIRLGRVFTSMPHYLFAKFGIHEAFAKYAGTRPIITKAGEYSEEEFPREHWVAVSSMRVAPRGVNSRRDYGAIASDIVLLVDRGSWSDVTRELAAGFFYVIDHFPEFVTDPADLEDTWWWKIFMSFILWGENDNYGKAVTEIEQHLQSLDGYVDAETIKTLEEVSVECKDLYDLMAYIMREMQNMLDSRRGREGCLYNKRLEVLRYLMRDINNSVFEFLFKVSGGSKKEMTDKDYEKLLRTHFKPWHIHNISNQSIHPEVSSVSNPTDNMFFKITSNIVQQADTHGRGRGQETKPIGPTMFLDSSFAAVTSFGSLPKSNPIGNNRFNPTAVLDRNLTTTMPEKHKELLDSVQKLIQRT